jgi:hypothetical protein
MKPLFFFIVLIIIINEASGQIINNKNYDSCKTVKLTRKPLDIVNSRFFLYGYQYESEVLNNGNRCFGLKNFAEGDEKIIRIWFLDNFRNNASDPYKLSLLDLTTNSYDISGKYYVMDYNFQEDGFYIDSILSGDVLCNNFSKDSNKKFFDLNILQTSFYTKGIDEGNRGMGANTLIFLQVIEGGVCVSYNFSNRTDISSFKTIIDIEFYKLVNLLRDNLEIPLLKTRDGTDYFKMIY